MNQKIRTRTEFSGPKLKLFGTKKLGANFLHPNFGYFPIPTGRPLGLDYYMRNLVIICCSCGGFHIIKKIYYSKFFFWSFRTESFLV